MEVLVGIIFGFILGYLVLNRAVRRKMVGSLIINMTDTFNDQPFLLELNTSVSTVYHKDYIVLKITRN